MCPYDKTTAPYEREKEMKITIDLYREIGQMSGQEKHDLIEFLACEDLIINHVVEMIMTGYTYNGSCGTKTNTFKAHPNGYALDNAKRYIAENSSEMTKEYLEKAENILEDLRKQNTELKIENEKLDKNVDILSVELKKYDQEYTEKQKQNTKYFETITALRKDNENLIQELNTTIAKLQFDTL